MPNIAEKIGRTVISEIVEAIFFGICLYVALLLPEDSVRQSIVTSIIILWAVAGIGTPIVIFTEFGEMFSELFSGGGRR